jgi:hypothetical protein
MFEIVQHLIINRCVGVSQCIKECTADAQIAPLTTMATTTQHQDHALLFLSNHSLEEAAHFGLNINKQTLSHDPSATITVSGDKVVVEYSVPDSDAKRVFTSQPPYSFYTCTF